MPFYSYVHGARGAVHVKMVKIADSTANPSYNDKKIAIVPIAAGVAWDEGFDYVPIHEGFRELYVQVAGTRLGSWTVRGIVVSIGSGSSDFYDAFQAADVLVGDSLQQPFSGGYMFTAPKAGVQVVLFDGVHVVQFTGIVLTVSVIAPVEGIVTMEFSGLTTSNIQINRATGNVYNEGALKSMRILDNTRKNFIRSASGNIRLVNTRSTPAQELNYIHALSFDVTVAREAQVIYSYGNPANDALVHNEDKAYGEIFGSRRFTTPLVVSQGISSVGCTMLLEGKMLKRAQVESNGSFGSANFVESPSNQDDTQLFPPPADNITIYEPWDLEIAWPHASGDTTYHRISVKNVILTGKRIFQLSRPRPIYMFTARPNALVPAAASGNNPAYPLDYLAKFSTS